MRTSLCRLARSRTHWASTARTACRGEARTNSTANRSGASTPAGQRAWVRSLAVLRFSCGFVAYLANDVLSLVLRRPTRKGAAAGDRPTLRSRPVQSIPGQAIVIARAIAECVNVSRENHGHIDSCHESASWRATGPRMRGCACACLERRGIGVDTDSEGAVTSFGRVAALWSWQRAICRQASAPVNVPRDATMPPNAILAIKLPIYLCIPEAGIPAGLAV